MNTAYTILAAAPTYLISAGIILFIIGVFNN